MLLVSFQKSEFLRGFNLLRGLIAPGETFFRLFFFLCPLQVGRAEPQIGPPTGCVGLRSACPNLQLLAGFREFADVTLDAVETMVGKEQFVPTLP